MSTTKASLLEKVKTDLAAIEQELRANLNPYLDLVAQTAGHLLFAGGKRFRPLLMVLCARLNGYRGDRDKMFSTAFEYIHAATLLHDDVVDGALLRRSQPAAHSLWGIPTTVLVGDFLLARALAIGAETGKLDVITVLADITGRMAQGEIHQLSKKGDICLTEAEYLDIIGNKTAVLIQGACRVGALIADAAAHQQKAVGTYGFHIGMAFQMVDDMLDYIAQTDCLGKTVGTDLREAKMTLPLIHLMARLAPQERQIVKEVMGKTDLPEDQFLAVVALMEKYNSLAYVRTCAEDHVARAKAALMGFDPSETRSLLLNVADYAIAREQ